MGEWNREIRDQENGKKTKTGILMKTALMLKQWWDEKRSRAATTIVLDSMASGNDRLRNHLRGSARAAGVNFLPAAKAAATTAPPPDTLPDGLGFREFVPPY